jgi:hypothetical protein
MRFEGIQNAFGWLAGLILLTLPCAAQMQVGDDLRMNLNGNLGFTYAGGINQGLSDHSMGFSGNGNLTGSYYNPNFLNFNVDPFYRADSSSVFGNPRRYDGRDVECMNLFSSHFPGSVSYNRLFNGTSCCAGSDIGLCNFLALGTGLAGALIPGWPTLTANYSVNNNFQLDSQNTEQ